ncbi:hypothetical protein [Pelagibius sp.]|uniref:hypothetical protein n=1 Tax=Pelagibius sp. TaxID=1931238 RepID=UPI00261E7621|nr:hypothetical protein [Pelagibius sp.]
MKRLLLLAATAVTVAALANTVETADAQSQKQGFQQFAPKQKEKPSPAGKPVNKPAVPGKPAASQPLCLTGFTRTELKHYNSGSYKGHLQRMTCLSPVIQCPEPTLTGVTIGIDVNKVLLSPETGLFRVEYKCKYTGTIG